MDPIITFDTVKQYCAFNQQLAQHPLVAMVDLSMAAPRHLQKMRLNLYFIFLKEIKCGDLKYGCNTYDYDEGTLVFLGPGQIVGSKGTEMYQPKGWALVFHPEFLSGTPLAGNMERYSFFSYAMKEALHLSEKERALIQDGFDKISYELSQLIDKHTKRLVASNIELLLNYCTRFYDRQFITRGNVNQDVLTRFELLLNDYFQPSEIEKAGLPTVNYFANQLNLSPNYLGDLVKKESGKSPQEHIQLKLITLAKDRLFDPELSIAEVAYGLGFAYPQHFSRMFKKATGVTPGTFRRTG